MASLSGLPTDLRAHAKRMPDGLLRELHQGEAEFRLRHVDDLMGAAESLPAEQHRHVTAMARHELAAMPNAQYVAERDRLEKLRGDARRAGNHDVANAFLDALTRLEEEHPQVSGVQEAMMAWDKKHQQVSKAKPSATQVTKMVEREMRAAKAEFERKQAELRKEIRELQEKANRGRP